jgi:hypothetical protein
MSPGFGRDRTPRVKCRESGGRMMLGLIVGGRRALKEVTFARKEGERRGRHMKCVFGEDLKCGLVVDFGFMMGHRFGNGGWRRSDRRCRNNSFQNRVQTPCPSLMQHLHDALLKRE